MALLQSFHNIATQPPSPPTTTDYTSRSDSFILHGNFMLLENFIFFLNFIPYVKMKTDFPLTATQNPQTLYFKYLKIKL